MASIDADDERGVSADLLGLELGRLLKDLGENVSSEQLTTIGGKIEGKEEGVGKLQSEQIYNDNFEDDEGLDLGPDTEGLTESGGERSDGRAKETDRYFQLGLSAMSSLRHQASPMVEVRKLLPHFDPHSHLDFTTVFSGPSPSKRRRLGQFKPHFSQRHEVGEVPLWPSLRAPLPFARLERAKPLLEADISVIEHALRDPMLDDWPADETTSGREASVKAIESDKQRGTWDDAAIRWRPDSAVPPVALIMDPNDPEMIFEEQLPTNVEPHGQQSEPAPRVLSSRAARAAANLNPLNLSNDRFYEIPREHRHKVRQTLGQLVVQHAKPAVKLQVPFYKTRLSKSEVTSFHRPAMQFPVNVPLHFSRLQSSRKKREDRGKVKKGKDATEVLTSTRDLTLRDAGPFVLYEYSEEHPLLLSNLGMGHVLVNYYRKKSPKDETIPKAEMGAPFILDVADESPFMGFGSVEAGQVQPILYNNLVRAPLFKHQAGSGDFLLIRHTTKDKISYLLRDIPHVFTVGQLFPAVQIPGPHARLATNMIKTRLYMIAHKLVQRSKGDRIKIHRLMRYFPDQNELQMRQRLKEFMEYNRRAGDPNQGYWKLKPNVAVPEEADLLKQLPPEHMVLCESMQAGQQRLIDAGFINSAEDADDNDDEDDNALEQSLAPWTASKNFLSSSERKARLALHGEGDPSGRGDAFSFIRVSMKEVFVAAGEDAEERKAAAEAEALSKSGHKYNVAEQEQIYRSEIARIWRQQLFSLSQSQPPKITAKDLVPMQRAMQAYTIEAESARQAQALEEKEEAYAGTKYDANKVLRIRRMRDGKWYTEIVRDRGVIEAYMRHRHALKDAQTDTEALVPTGDAELDAARRKRLAAEIGQLQKNQDRRLQRKQAKAAADGTSTTLPKLNKSGTKRVCGRCGQVGHMSTNTSCPMYGRIPGSEKSAVAPSTSGNVDFGQTSVPADPRLAASDASNSAPQKIKIKIKR